MNGANARGQMDSQPTIVTVPLSFVEYRLNFSETLLEEWRDNGTIVKALLRALRPWNVQLSGVSIKPSPANLGEIQIIFEVVPQKVVFNLFLGAATLFAANLSWTEAPFLRGVIEAVRPVLVERFNVEIANQQVTLNMHLTPQGKTVREITKRFSPSDQERDDGSVRAFGFSIYRKESSCVVDLSLMYENSLFVRLIRSFDKSHPVSEIESALQTDQANVLSWLHLKLD